MPIASVAAGKLDVANCNIKFEGLDPLAEKMNATEKTRPTFQ